MFNAVRMDIYRLIHTKSAYVILVIAMALAIATSGMTALVRSMAAESIVETTDEVTMVSESDSEIADEYDTASAESSNEPTATVGLEVDDSDMSDEVPTIADMVESDIAGLDLALLLAIFTVLFSTADLNSGVAIHWTITSSAMATKVNTESAIIFENSSTPRHFTCPPTLFI